MRKTIAVLFLSFAGHSLGSNDGVEDASRPLSLEEEAFDFDFEPAIDNWAKSLNSDSFDLLDDQFDHIDVLAGQMNRLISATHKAVKKLFPDLNLSQELTGTSQDTVLNFWLNVILECDLTDDELELAISKQLGRISVTDSDNFKSLTSFVSAIVGSLTTSFPYCASKEVSTHRLK